MIIKHATKKIARSVRVRAKVRGNSDRPRLSIYRSNAYIYAQIIDDTKGKTLVSVNPKEITTKGTKSELSQSLGELIAKKALKAKIKAVCFDRGGNRYHGRIKIFATAARSSGLEF